MATNDLIRSVDYVRYSKQSQLDEEYGWCDACGAVTPFRFVEVINDTLAEQWKLSAEERHFMSSRESRYCDFCGCSYRLRMLARALRGVVAGSDAPSLRQAIEQGIFNDLKIAEINSCGKLHGIIQDLPGLSYSEYGPVDPSIAHEDLMQLSYADNTFDIVMTSDTLEHVPDVDRALREIQRVLKPGGIHLFTVPWLLTRPTVARTAFDDKQELDYLEPASFHGSGEPDYLVWHEFGGDFLEANRQAGFEPTILFQNVANLVEPSNVLLARKPGKETPKDEQINLDGPVTAGDRSKLQALLKKSGVKLPVAEAAAIQSMPLAYDENTHAMIGQLAGKLSLTEDHATNQSQQAEALRVEVDKLREHIAALDTETRRAHAELKTLQSSRVWRAYRKASGIVRGRK